MASQSDFVFPRTERAVTIGRDPSCDVPLRGIGASRTHAILHIGSRAIVIEDCRSTFGTRVNGNPVSRAELGDGAVITAGVAKFRIDIDDRNVTLVPFHDAEIPPEDATYGRTPADVAIGRDPSNTVCLPHPLVSRFHATFRAEGDARYSIEDHGSTNGTFVNGKAVRTSVLDEGDVVQVGPYRFFLDAGALKQTQDFNRIRIEAFNVGVTRGKATLVDDVSLSMEPGEFVAILGPSGAGKSTLANALTGQIPLSSGEVYYNGLPMRTFCSAFNSTIGFVSQHNLLRSELTVLETFTEQSILRLPRDSMPAEHRERIREVMELLELSALAKRKIGDLSGGEAKRVHFGMELLSSPTVIFLDEPLAGLDPGLTHKFMELFRSICDKGHTILLTTHTLEQIELCNRILFVSRGKLLFAGSPKELRGSFGTVILADVYEKARTLPASAVAAATKPVVTPKKKIKESGYDESVRLYKPKSVSFLRQMKLLTGRYAVMLVRDARTLALMLLQAPLIALLLAFVFNHGGDFLPLSFYFCISISVIWMGGMNSVREIAREWDVVEREFRVGLSKTAYGLSKLLVFCLLAAVQALLFGACLHVIFAGFSLGAGNGALLCSGCAAGALLGLCVSAFSPNVNVAISFLPIIFIPQIFFSGILMPFDEMPGAGMVLSNFTIARPVFSMFKKMCFFERTPWMLGDWLGLSLLCGGLTILLFTGIRFRRLIQGKGFGG
jgi:ABC transport system ATP-binding/permease protein